MNNKRRLDRGFTLLEVLVAFSILGVMISSAMGIFSTSMALQTKASDQREALAIAQSKLAEITSLDRPALGLSRGEVNARFSWRAQIKSWSFPEQQFSADSSYEPIHISVTVRLDGQSDDLILLETIKLISRRTL